MVDERELTRHPECACDGDVDDGTLRLTHAIDLMVRVNAMTLDLCDRQVTMALVLVMHSIYHNAGYEDELADRVIDLAIETSRKLRDQTVARAQKTTRH